MPDSTLGMKQNQTEYDQLEERKGHRDLPIIALVAIGILFAVLIAWMVSSMRTFQPTYNPEARNTPLPSHTEPLLNDTKDNATINPEIRPSTNGSGKSDAVPSTEGSKRLMETPSDSYSEDGVPVQSDTVVPDTFKR